MAKSSTKGAVQVGGIVPRDTSDIVSRRALQSGARSVNTRPAIDSNHSFILVCFADNKSAKKFEAWLSKYRIAEAE